MRWCRNSYLCEKSVAETRIAFTCRATRTSHSHEWLVRVARLEDVTCIHVHRKDLHRKSRQSNAGRRLATVALPSRFDSSAVQRTESQGIATQGMAKKSNAVSPFARVALPGRFTAQFGHRSARQGIARQGKGQQSNAASPSRRVVRVVFGSSASHRSAPHGKAVKGNTKQRGNPVCKSWIVESFWLKHGAAIVRNILLGSAPQRK